MNGNNTFWSGVCDIMANLFLIFLILYALTAADEKAAVQRANELHGNLERMTTDYEVAESQRYNARLEADEEIRKRHEAEKKRGQAEDERDKAETQQYNARLEADEEIRKRHEAEKKRGEAEDGRDKAEQARREAETQRYNARLEADEEIRKRHEAEKKRGQAEDERDKAETQQYNARLEADEEIRKRHEAEKKRGEAEDERDKAWANFEIASDGRDSLANELNEFKQRSRQLVGLAGPFNNVVWVIDLSGSIDKTNRLLPYKKEINLQITTLNFQTFNVITFFGEVGKDNVQVDRVKSWKPLLEQATPENRNLAAKFIEQHKASGGTPTHAALLKALAMPEVDTIVFFSDGQPTDTKDYKVILNDIREKSTGQVINVVAFGEYFHQSYGDFLYQLAEQNGGQFLGR